MIEDEDAIRDILEYNLTRAGYRVACAADGRAGLRLASAENVALVVLDIMLPELDGIEVCKRLRQSQATEHIPVIMLTAKDSEDDVVAGLGAGADDYVTKPFSPRELTARVDAMLRRESRLALMPSSVVTEKHSGTSRGDVDNPRVVVGSVDIDMDRFEVRVDGSVVAFTRTELRLLCVLLTRPGRVYSRDRLVDKVMGESAWITDRTIDVHVRAIRKKLGLHADMIETIRGVGYRCRDESRS